MPRLRVTEKAADIEALNLSLDPFEPGAAPPDGVVVAVRAAGVNPSGREGRAGRDAVCRVAAHAGAGLGRHRGGRPGGADGPGSLGFQRRTSASGGTARMAATSSCPAATSG